MQEQNVGPVLSTIVILAAIAITFTTYGYYNDTVVAKKYESAQASMDQAASALMSFRLDNQADSEVEMETEPVLE